MNEFDWSIIFWNQNCFPDRIHVQKFISDIYLPIEIENSQCSLIRVGTHLSVRKFKGTKFETSSRRFQFVALNSRLYWLEWNQSDILFLTVSSSFLLLRVASPFGRFLSRYLKLSTPKKSRTWSDVVISGSLTVRLPIKLFREIFLLQKLRLEISGESWGIVFYTAAAKKSDKKRRYC